MQAYSQDLRERVAAAAALPDRTQGQVAAQFGVSVSFVAKLQQRQRLSGTVAAKPHSGGAAPCLTPRAQKRALAQVARCPDTTLGELQAWLISKGLPAASESTLCRLLAHHGWGRKKKTSTPASVTRPACAPNAKLSSKPWPAKTCAASNLWTKRAPT